MDFKYILSIDQGTTGTTSSLMEFTQNQKPKFISSFTQDFLQHYPKNNWVEHKLDEIWTSVLISISKTLEFASLKNKNFHKNKICAIGITNQRETLCTFSRKSYEPLYPAIVWQCKRSLNICKKLREMGYSKTIYDKTGLFIDPYFTGTKIKWLMDNNDSIRREVHKGNALFGTIDTFLTYKITDGKSYVSEPSNASRTMLYNINDLNWDPFLLDLMSVPSEDNLPNIMDSNSFFGITKNFSLLPDGIPIYSILGDQQSALYGQSCFKKNQAKCTYGTGAFLMLNTGNEIIRSKHNLLSTIAWSINKKTNYALEGSSFIAGSAVQFIRDNLSLIKNASDTEHLESIKAAPDIIFVPALSGLGSPWWESNCKGAIFGLTRSTSKQQIIKATLEGISFLVNDLISSFNEEPSVDLHELRTDGGASQNNLLMQLQANISQLTIRRPENIETTSLGTALLAAETMGIYNDTDKQPQTDSVLFNPEKTKGKLEYYNEMKKNWKKAVQAAILFQ